MASSCEGGNEPLGTTNGREFLDQLRNGQTSQDGLCSMEKVSKAETEFGIGFGRILFTV